MDVSEGATRLDWNSVAFHCFRQSEVKRSFRSSAHSRGESASHKQFHSNAYAPNYVSNRRGYECLRAHYLNAGPKQAQNTLLCPRGEPIWSHLYRKIIPVMLASGARVIAPDFFGLGRCAKLVALGD